MRQAVEFHVSYEVLSEPGLFAIHAYFDICPESPDGTRMVYTRFPGRWPGRSRAEGAPAEVIALDLATGERRLLGRCRQADGHSGPWAQWLDDDHVVFSDNGCAHRIHTGTGAVGSWPGALQSWHPEGGGLFCPRVNGLDEHAWPDGLYHLDPFTGAARLIVSGETLRAQRGGEGLPADGSDWLCHAKWSPSAERVAVLHRVLWTAERGEQIMRIFTCRPDGSDLRWFPYQRDGYDHKPLHWHWWDDGSFYGYDVAEAGRPCRRWSLDGELLETLHTGPGNHAALAPVGQSLVTDSFYGEDPLRLYHYRRGAGEPTVLLTALPLTGADAHPVFSRDGRAVYAQVALERGGPSVIVRLTDLPAS